jgi:hypothetical protein
MAIERVEVPVANTPDPDQIVRDADSRAEAALVLGGGFFFEALGVVLVRLPGGWTRMRWRDTVAGDRERVDAGGQIAQDQNEVRLLLGSAIVEVAFGDSPLRPGQPNPRPWHHEGREAFRANDAPDAATHAISLTASATRIVA